MWILSLKNGLITTFAGIKIRFRHTRFPAGNKCQNVCEWVKVEERNEDGSIPSPAALQIVSVCECKPD